jgi:hypothetical protein
MRDRGGEQIERITLAASSLYLAVFASYIVFVRYTGLMNGSLLDKALALGYAVSSLPLPMFAVAKSLMPRGWRYAVDVRNSFVAYLCLVYAVTFLGNWILLHTTRSTYMYPVAFGLALSVVYLALSIYYSLKN